MTLVGDTAAPARRLLRRAHGRAAPDKLLAHCASRPETASGRRFASAAAMSVGALILEFVLVLAPPHSHRAALRSFLETSLREVFAKTPSFAKRGSDTLSRVLLLVQQPFPRLAPRLPDACGRDVSCVKPPASRSPRLAGPRFAWLLLRLLLPPRCFRRAACTSCSPAARRRPRMCCTSAATRRAGPAGVVQDAQRVGNCVARVASGAAAAAHRR